MPARVEAVELQIVQLRTEMRAAFSEVRQEMGAMRVGLHEEVISKIATMEEDRRPRRKK